MRDALVQIVLRLRDDVLKEKDGGYNPSVGADSLGSGHSVPSTLPSVRPVPSLSYDQKTDVGSSLGMLSSSNLYGYGSLSVCVGIYVTPSIIIANYCAQFFHF